MNKHLLVSVGLLSGLACSYAQPPLNTWGQDGVASGAHSAAQTQTQRQAELRSALRAQRYRSANTDKMRREHQLSAQERSELRQQLRQQGREWVNR